MFIPHYLSCVVSHVSSVTCPGLQKTGSMGPGWFRKNIFGGKKEISTHGRLDTTVLKIWQNLAQLIILSIVMGICSTLRLVSNNLSDIVFFKSGAHFFGYFCLPIWQNMFGLTKWDYLCGFCAVFCSIS